jgi:hypothetical protein
MGTETCRAVEGAEDLELVARIGRGDPLDALAGADVAVELTRPDSVMANLQACIAAACTSCAAPAASITNDWTPSAAGSMTRRSRWECCSRRTSAWAPS